MLSTVMILAGCSKNEGGEGEPFTPPAQEQLTQNAYADNENTGGGFSFTADAPWTATVDERLRHPYRQNPLHGQPATTAIT